MKNIKLSLIVMMGLGTFVYGGGDITAVTVYETDDLELATAFATEVEVTPPTSYIETTVPPENGSAVPILIPPLKSKEKKPAIIPIVPKSTEKTPVVKNEIETVSEPIKESDSSGGTAYIGLGGTIVQYDTNCNCPDPTLSGTDKSGGIIAKAGYEFNQYLGIEARGIKTVIKEDGGEVEHIGIFVKPSYPINEKSSLYGLVGWGKTTTSGTLRKTDVDGLAFGVGVDYDVTNEISIFADYERLFYESDAPKLDSISMGANYNF
jgi:OOP family OmpA-OmpF porin